MQTLQAVVLKQVSQYGVQSTQNAELTFDHCPGLQSRHDKGEEAPTDGKYLPAEQGVHADDPKFDEYCPTGQSIHDADPGLAEY